jgi:hypothetical protein
LARSSALNLACNMQLYNTTAIAVINYSVTRDPKHLSDAIAALQAEIDDPDLQEGMLRLDNMTTAEGQDIMGTLGYLRISTGQITNFLWNSEEIPEIISDKMIRVVGSDVPIEDKMPKACFIARVGHIDDNLLLLVAVGPLIDQMQEGANNGD